MSKRQDSALVLGPSPNLDKIDSISTYRPILLTEPTFPLRSQHHDSNAIKRCYRSGKGRQRCVVCGVTSVHEARQERHMHLPIGHVGHFCSRCCPVCEAASPGGRIGELIYQTSAD